MTDDPANDIPACLRALADRKLKGVVCIVVEHEGLIPEVHSFGEMVRDGAEVDKLLDLAKKIIVRP